ncbi:MAG TPA: CDP-2,3-bis-(O-geranylgeranyl)-sn-glycerol synthase [Candidatus Aenigmarchaeota archaeon]|nr:MAG: CDP-2,3-bis-(O-geranylgeranyl)-sn-glycerol synthase [Candidatus Aenigmarchaeota archaeon]HDD46352.1 CDP-2,3-bis-(O-geranylgeranyl)-sn-glycerol synthase [Candidatus Aenigmarchaeota archaeon]
MIDVFTLIESIWLILPAYAANGLVPLFKGKHVMDGGKKFIDRMRLFGDGKTWEGFIGGCVIGVLIATIEMLAFPYLPFDQSPVTLTIVEMTPLLGFLLGFGAMLGDLMGSFIKRRLKIERGGKAPLLDQLDFLVGALACSALIVRIKIEWVVWLFILTPIFHLIANRIGYLLKVKSVPW